MVFAAIENSLKLIRSKDGVLRGFILRHILFLIYINYRLNLKANVNHLQMILPYFRLFTILISPKMIRAVTCKRYMSGHTNGKLNSISMLANMLKK